MKRIFFRVGMAMLVQCACSGPDVSLYVDPNIGGVAPLLTTKNPTVHRPHSMVRVFPLTKPGLNDRFLSDRIYGFACNMPAYRNGHVTELMPASGKLILDRNRAASLYDHDLEEVHPWYHRVWLEDYGIVADWTTTERAVLYRFKFDRQDSCHLVFRARGNSNFETVGDRIIQGWEEFGPVKQYFCAEFSVPFADSESFTTEPSDSERSRSRGVVASFSQLQEAVEVRIGISYIGEDQAARNLHQEAGQRGFEAIAEESHRIWKDALGRIRVEGGTERQKRILKRPKSIKWR